MSIEDSTTNIEPGKYLLAVSGGVDSMTLLDLLSNADVDFDVIHFNHGIRSNSESKIDFDLVKSVCHDKNIKLITQDLKLGIGASESDARSARLLHYVELTRGGSYNRIITAHHSDDVIETMIINLLRGTGRSGLSSLKSDEMFLRPLLNFSKNDILLYAKKNNIRWQEDSTNQDSTLTRNYVRNILIPNMESQDEHIKGVLLHINRKMLDLNTEINDRLGHLADDIFNGDGYDKNKLIMLPIEVEFAILHYIIYVQHSVETSGNSLKLLRNFIHTASDRAIFEFSKHCHVVIDGNLVKFQIN